MVVGPEKEIWMLHESMTLCKKIFIVYLTRERLQIGIAYYIKYIAVQTLKIIGSTL